MTNKFCGYLTHGLNFNLTNMGNLTVKPCCLFGESIKFDSDFLKNRKEKFESIDGWTANCNWCHIQELNGQPSLRNSYSDFVLLPDTDDAPVAIDIHLDNECNAACVICNENNSSLWAKENSKQFGGEYMKFNNVHTDNAINAIISTLSMEKLIYVRFHGGDPLYTNTHLKFINELPYPENIVLQYTTNGSIHPNSKTLEAWKKFKLVYFVVSIDGIEDQFDYLRWPLTWEAVSNNLQKIKDVAPNNLLFRVEYTANLLNTYYYDRLENWVATIFPTNRLGDKTEINIHLCKGTWDINLMPYSVRTLILKKYDSTHVINRLVSNLPEPLGLDSWNKFVVALDIHRKNSWKNTFSELANYI